MTLPEDSVQIVFPLDKKLFYQYTLEKGRMVYRGEKTKKEMGLKFKGDV